MASMFSQAAKTTTQTTKQVAVAVARGIANQTNETIDTAKAQVGLPSAEKPQSIDARQEVPKVVQEIQSHGPSDIDRQAIASRERAMLANLEARLAQMRAQKTQELATYNQAVQTKMDAQVQESPVETMAPQGKIRKAMGKAKKAVTSLISNRKQGETKQGSGKG